MLKQWIFRVVLFTLPIIASILTAKHAVSSEVFTYLPPAELKGLQAREEQGLRIIDSRSAEEFQEAHIRGAESIPLSVLERAPASLRHDKSDRLVFYCNGFS